MPERRLQKVRRHLESSRLDALLISHLPHVRYLTGFSGSNGLVVITRRRQHLLTDNRYRDQVTEEVSAFDCVIAPKGLNEAVRTNGILRAAKRVGFEAQYVSMALFANLKKLFPNRTFVSTHSVVEGIAAVKDEHEVGLIRKAASITDRIFRKLLTIIKPGMSEAEVAAEISYWNRRYGSEGDAFEPIVASGPRGALPHARPSPRKIRSGELVTLDLGSRVGGYHSDLTRTVAVGTPRARAKTIYKVVLEAQQKAVDAARAGVTARRLDAVARNHIRRKGLGRFFSHSLGHGLGIEIHEMLRLSALSKETLRVGNVVTIEPGIYVPGFGGVRIEDDVVIREHDCEVLNQAPKELIVL